ncbi:hypothetical protein IVB24_09285 [Bradyrhizobium sp. 192]|nr:hypothetical protein IVB24_09285 [Bradyrhizobium sp. 192]
MSTGDRTILGRISRLGKRYLRTLFVQGVRAVLLRRQSWPRQSLVRSSIQAAPLECTGCRPGRTTRAPKA